MHKKAIVDSVLENIILEASEGGLAPLHVWQTSDQAKTSEALDKSLFALHEKRAIHFALL